MSLRDDVLPIISQGWALVQEKGVTQYRVVIRTLTYPGGENGPEIGLGVPTFSDLLLVPNPWVEETNSGSGLKLEGITPKFPGGGYTPAQLNPRPFLTVGQDVLYVVTGPNGTYYYDAADIDTSDAFEYKLMLNGLTRPVPY